MATQGEPTSWADEVEEESLRGSMHGNLSWISWAFVAFLVVFSLAIVIGNVEDAALLPGFALGPFVVLYFGYWRHLKHEIPVDLVVKHFAFGFIPGAIIVVIVETILTGLFFMLCFSDQIPQWYSQLVDHSKQVQTGPMAAGAALNATAQDLEDPVKAVELSLGIKISRTPGFYFFIFLLAYAVAAGTEETMKYCTPLRFKGCQNSPSPYVYLVCTVACALGFSSVENVGYTFSGGGAAQSAFAERVATAYSRAVVAIAAHSVCGGIVGLGLTRRYVLGQTITYFGIIAPAVLAHGTFDFLQLVLATMVMDEFTRFLCVVAVCFVVLLAAGAYLAVNVRRLQLYRLREEGGMLRERGGEDDDDEEKLLHRRHGPGPATDSI